ncbi:unnamed protein product [Didymodactylos carnosus]|uniref:Transposase n=1 Tax=Didymodactylos carnosus TaxID=1234261 RepID=A0A815XUG0_9BILA|nr:unnamed protein product [Didymodactylos carnosus]CAF4424166.1 unnamed protein product [Didymodactylos carnosus]
MNDGSKGVTAAHQQEFPNARRLMCYAHVIGRCRAHRKVVPPDKWNDVEQNIWDLQLCSDDYVFNVAATLLLQKWNNNTDFHRFAACFKTEWIDSLCFWYEDAVFNNPSMNNGLESLNGELCYFLLK